MQQAEERSTARTGCLPLVPGEGARRSESYQRMPQIPCTSLGRCHAAALLTKSSWLLTAALATFIYDRATRPTCSTRQQTVL